ncbi:MAG: hypothetical protein Q7O66_13945 [Dehalococcoidia bacterium]|nr:hypothetical protein [Dehalococcoidia bacterium]
MTRVDELQKKYPSLPREIILKWDVLRHGVQDTEVIDRTGHWQRVGYGGYQSHDHDLSLKQVAEQRPERVKPNYRLRTSPFYMRNGLGVRVELDRSSPYNFREIADNQYAIFEGEEKVEDIYFPFYKSQTSEEFFTSKGTPLSTLINSWRRCFQIAPIRFCEFFTRGEECKFCNYNSTHEAARAIGQGTAVTTDLDDTLEAYKILSSNVRLIEGRFQNGAFRNPEQEGELHVRFVEKIASAASYTPNICYSTTPLSRKNLQRLKDAGVTCVNSNKEVWDPEVFAEVCPGKAKYRGHERYLEFYQEAVDILGTGNVACVLPAGVSVIPDNGHKTWQESRDSLVEGARWLIKHGALPVFLALRLVPGSKYGDDKSNKEKLPPTEYLLDAGLAHHKAMLEFGLYDKLNKLMFCPMDCLWALYGGEIGILERAGNPGNWLAGTIPDDGNWLASFVSSVESLPAVNQEG